MYRLGMYKYSVALVLMIDLQMLNNSYHLVCQRPEFYEQHVTWFCLINRPSSRSYTQEGIYFTSLPRRCFRAELSFISFSAVASSRLAISCLYLRSFVFKDEICW